MTAVASPPTAASAPPMRAPWLRIALFAARRKRLSPLAWGLGLGLMSLMIVAVFPSIQGSSQLDELIRSYPNALKEAFGISDASFATIEGYLAAEVFSLIAPFATSYFMIHALAAGICGSERSGMLNLWPLGVFFGGVTLLLTGVWRRPGTVTGAAAGVLVTMYLMEVLGKLSGTMAAVDDLSAFHYYGSAIEDGLDPTACAGLVAAGLLLGGAGCVLFERRDVGT